MSLLPELDDRHKPKDQPQAEEPAQDDSQR
jgi:hypothetical protein